MSTLQEIERAIDNLSATQLEELYGWLDENHPQRIDARISVGLATGVFDNAIHSALDDEAKGAVKPLKL